jgi:hypothetical protein
MKKPTWIKGAYQTTSVYWGKTQGQLMVMLEQIGIQQVRFTSLPDRFVLEFVSVPKEKGIPRGVRIVVPLVNRPSDQNDKRNKELNVIHRIVFNHLKAKFIAIESGITEFEQEFMAHLIIKDKNGRDTTIGETILPQYNKNIQGKGGQFLLGSGE